MKSGQLLRLKHKYDLPPFIGHVSITMLTDVSTPVFARYTSVETNQPMLCIDPRSDHVDPTFHSTECCLVMCDNRLLIIDREALEPA